MTVCKKSSVILAAAVFIGTVTSCGRVMSLEKAYAYEERPFAMEALPPSQGRAELFASELCVVSDENQFSDGTVTAQAASVFDISGSSVIYSKNAFEKLNPASVTKVMTALIAIKYGDLTDQVVVAEEARITESGATLCHIEPGDVLTMEQLLYGLMLPSGNDAGNAIAVHMAESVEGFATMMNEEARKLGATGTHFMNPHGLTDENHYTTAYDLYLIFNEALKQPEFRKVTGTTSYYAEYTNQAGEAKSQTWKGGNWYMVGERDTPVGLTVFGGKTGTTSAAGYCLIMGSRDASNNEYISVVLKAPSRPGLYDNMTNIINKIVN